MLAGRHTFVPPGWIGLSLPREGVWERVAYESRVSVPERRRPQAGTGLAAFVAWLYRGRVPFSRSARGGLEKTAWKGLPLLS